ncbi:hypothetical protein [Methylobacterium sp. NEAU K]|uniref:hypothetical protein n=1 Tax=Methylobacterium sp. NEAU K TaxID=3064946 RepID=UPI0027327BE0|nr:hypothetical protein [Methylobacterium sp. NEAU K]MDP4005069.1 hypothetical protein [Methylobacterium sp. NEAU K]
MARCYVFPTQADAQACVDGINARARTVYAAQGYAVDSTGAITGKRASDGVLLPNAAKTLTWDMPRQRLDGNWVVRHCEAVPGNSFVVDATKTPPVTVADFVAQDIAATVAVEVEDASWWPAPPTLKAIV